MSGGQVDIRRLLQSVANPRSPEEYIRDQQTLSELYKQPGECSGPYLAWAPVPVFGRMAGELEIGTHFW